MNRTGGWLTAALTVILLAAFSINAVAAETEQASIIRASSSDGSIEVYFDAVDNYGNCVMDLSEQNVALALGAQTISLTRLESARGTPISCLFLINVAPDMPKADMELLKKAIAAWTSEIGSEDFFAVAPAKAALNAEFTQDAQKLGEAVAALDSANGSDDLSEVITQALKAFELNADQLPLGKAIVLYVEDIRGATLDREALCAALGQAGVNLYVVGYGSRGNLINDLGYIARATGGAFTRAVPAGTIGKNLFENSELMRKRIEGAYIAKAEISGDISQPCDLTLTIKSQSGERLTSASRTLEVARTRTSPAANDTSEGKADEKSGDWLKDIWDTVLADLKSLGSTAYYIAGAVLFVALTVIALDKRRRKRSAARNSGPFIPKGSTLRADAPENSAQSESELNKTVCIRAPSSNGNKTSAPSASFSQDNPAPAQAPPSVTCMAVFHILLEDRRRMVENRVIKSNFIIGRSEQSDLRLPDQSVSGSHARMDFDGIQLTIEDLNSANGVYLGNDRLQGKYVVKNHDKIRLGKVLIEIVIHVEA